MGEMTDIVIVDRPQAPNPEGNKGYATMIKSEEK